MAVLRFKISSTDQNIKLIWTSFVDYPGENKITALTADHWSYAIHLPLAIVPELEI
jgi:hypothetical protein